MHYQEAQWIGSWFRGLEVQQISPVLDRGSSTESFRCHQQSHIDTLIFKPLRERKVKIIHQDIKPEAGVDIVGDLTSPQFLEELARLDAKCVICANLLEHLADRQPLIAALPQMLHRHGLLFLTVPYSYPKHKDPVDTMFRPTIAELVRTFPSLEVVEGTTINVGTVWSSVSKAPSELARMLFRMFLPFYNPSGWVTVAHRWAWFFRHRLVIVILFRKR